MYVGQPKKITDDKGEWISSIYRDEVLHPVCAGVNGLEGDKTTQPNHGGPNAAVCVYLEESYREWKALDSINLEPGSFGENFTVEGLHEEDLCAGDIVRVGGALLQIRGQRVPCANLTRRVGIPGFHKLAIRRGRVGGQLAVLEEGLVKPGDDWKLLERPNPGANLRVLNNCFFVDFDPVLAGKVLTMPGLDPLWASRAREHLDKWRAEQKAGNNPLL